MLGVFARYRALNRYFRRHDLVKSMNEWLLVERQRAGLPVDEY